MSGRVIPPQHRAVVAALWSVYYHSFFQTGSNPSFVPGAGLAPIPLHLALATLLEAEDSRARARRLRALAKLTAADMIRKERLAALLAPERWGGAYRHLGEVAASLDLPLEELERQVPVEAARMVLARNATIGCGPTDTRCVSCFDAVAMETTVTASGRVTRTLTDLKVALDPRQWDRCAGGVFVDAHRVVEDQHSNDAAHPGFTDEPADPDPSQFWLVFEHVLAGAGEFRNILNIKLVTDTVSEVRWSYSLVENLDTTMGGSSQPGMLTADHGFLRARRIDSTTSEVFVEKTVAFASDSLNVLAGPILCMWMEEVTEMPCC